MVYMDFEKAWNDALKSTEIVRSRIQALEMAGRTYVPYILLTESSINAGDTVVRKGEIYVEKPSLIIPPNNPQFNGFEFDELEDFEEHSMINFLILRGVRFPSLRYDNKTSSLEVFEGKLSEAVKKYEKILQQQENVNTGLIIGHEEYWQFSLIIFIVSQIARNADNDIRKLLAEYKRNNPELPE